MVISLDYITEKRKQIDVLGFIGSFFYNERGEQSPEFQEVLKIQKESYIHLILKNKILIKLV
jgi:hypothetical protein